MTKRRKNAQKRTQRISQPSSKARRNRNINPLESIRLQNRELMFSLTTDGSAEEVHSYELNPGLPAQFPWLSHISDAFESYVFHELKFEWCPAVSTATMGSIQMAVDYDPTDDNTNLSVNQISQFAGAVKSTLWDTDLEFRCRPRDLHRRKTYFVRNSTSANLSSTDVGQLVLTLQDSLPITYIGDIFVSYDITLFTPQMEPDDLGYFTITTTPSNPSVPYADGEYTVNQAVGNDIAIQSSNQLKFSKPGAKYLFTVQGDDATTITNVNNLSPAGGVGSVVTLIAEVISGSNWSATWEILTDATISAISPAIVGWAGVVGTSMGTGTVNIAEVARQFTALVA